MGVGSGVSTAFAIKGHTTARINPIKIPMVIFFFISTTPVVPCPQPIAEATSNCYGMPFLLDNPEYLAVRCR